MIAPGPRGWFGARSHLAAIVESSDDAIVGMRLDGTITSWNGGAERTYGYRAREVLGQSVSLLLVSGEHHDELTSMLDRIARGESIRRADATLRRKGGEPIVISVTISPIRDLLGRVIGASSVGRDVTERVEVERALQEAEERFRQAFEEAPIGMAILALDEHFEQVNEAFCQIAGYSREQLALASFRAITHPVDIAADEDGLRRVLAGETDGWRSEKRYLHAAGRSVWVAEQVSLLRDSARRPLRLLVQVQDVTERRSYEQRLRTLAERDALTGLLNRASFGRELESHRLLTQRYGIAGAAIVLDLDHFKCINDTLGHQAGDRALARAAEALHSRLRETDVLARLGGDEFGVLLPHADEHTARLVAEQLLSALSGEVVEIGGRLRSLAGSAGVSVFDDGTVAGEDVLVRADLAMYEAKNAGRGRVAVHRAGVRGNSRAPGRTTWTDRIADALEHDDFTLMTQPIVDLATGRASQHELLLRMHGEHGDLLPPGAFLYIAERLRMIGEIDRWVTRHAIELIADRRSRGEELTLMVNLSGTSIGDTELLELIGRELENAHVPAERLLFEVTETAAVANIGEAGRFADALGELGCRFALDDFGAGYGSFNYLNDLRFDFLKIDGDFVKGCATSDTDRLLIRAVVDIAAGMGKQTIAESVGDAETVAVLGRLGVDYGQGFHLGPPVALNGAIV